ncbi:MAG TPA: GAF domain-containing sensor histidine kinase [Aggregatilinea sp.]|jgi:signal transduction histidine kinase|uniref:GAF domain-containing sensor histidine kinase n=1 Tax=Aggregatilinea sp. TaxID=2806333 RepID=UPI002C744E23|nr:GAF domain-containing sensor histidine kinase [Aggregatilinea sp.]HML23946.1 GAF domain-containing sensor histidine kinase [Aggregatilinea sp.]
MSNGHANNGDERIALLIETAHRLKQGNYGVDLSVTPSDDSLDQLGLALQDLGHTLESRDQELRLIDRITARINAGLLLDEVLDNIYDDFRELIPYDRIGFAMIDRDDQIVTARWAKSTYHPIQLRRGFSAPLAGSTLAALLDSGQPRILNDLCSYLDEHPHSESTRLIVAEGIQSSLTCPLVANGVPVGFLFFSSLQPHTYAQIHIDVFQRIAAQLSIIVEKGELVSDLAAKNKAIERQNEELTRLNELKNTFLGIAAHDLRSPLGVIQMALNFLMDFHDNLSLTERDTILQDAEAQVLNMLNMIDELLDITQIEAGEMELLKGSIDIADFLMEAVADHDRMASTKGSHVMLDGMPAGIIEGDPFRLRQVIDNLLSNAVKFSPPGATVHVWAEELPDAWRINVQDEGPGVTENDRKRLFQNFARLSARPTAGERSTGLGLAITRRIIEQHNGKIDVESLPGGGAIFWITLPRKAA